MDPGLTLGADSQRAPQLCGMRCVQGAANKRRALGGDVMSPRLSLVGSCLCAQVWWRRWLAPSSTRRAPAVNREVRFCIPIPGETPLGLEPTIFGRGWFRVAVWQLCWQAAINYWLNVSVVPSMGGM